MDPCPRTVGSARPIIVLKVGLVPNCPTIAMHDPILGIPPHDATKAEDPAVVKDSYVNSRHMLSPKPNLQDPATFSLPIRWLTSTRLPPPTLTCAVAYFMSLDNIPSIQPPRQMKVS